MTTASTVTLTDEAWAQVMAILSTAPWRDANPLLMAIGEQLRVQQQNRRTDSQPPAAPDSPRAN